MGIRGPDRKLLRSVPQAAGNCGEWRSGKRRRSSWAAEQRVRSRGAGGREGLGVCFGRGCRWGLRAFLGECMMHIVLYAYNNLLSSPL